MSTGSAGASGPSASVSSASSGGASGGASTLRTVTFSSTVVELNRIALAVVPFEQLVRKHVFDLVLDHATQRARAEHLVEALLAQVVEQGVGGLERDLLAAQVVAHVAELEVHDLADVIGLEGAEDHRLVEAVEELGPEDALHLLGDLVLHPLVMLVGGLRLVLRHRESKPRVFANQVRPDVGGHDDDRVAEVDLAALGIGQVPVVEDLQQYVEDVRMCLLDLVEQDQAVAAPAHQVGELPAVVRSPRSRAASPQAARRCASP